jgi:hypothetical protein
MDGSFNVNNGSYYLLSGYFKYVANAQILPADVRIGMTALDNIIVGQGTWN